MIPVPSALEVTNGKQLWSSAEEELRRVIAREEVEQWFQGTHVTETQDHFIFLGVPSRDHQEYIEQNYQEVLSEIFSSILQRNIDVIIQVNHPVEEPAPTIGEKTTPLRLGSPAGTSIFHNEPINAGYTFENFVVGSSNKMASAAAQAVAEFPAKSYNPLFLYGGVGLGKTHLMQAIGNCALTRQPGIRVVYLSAEQFVNSFIDAIKRNERLTFQATFRNMDVLLIDDIQFLAGKESTQEEFFHTFNALHNRKKQIVISSDRPPKDIPTIEDRLRSRFEWGLIVDIAPPDFELRMAILRTKCEVMNCRVEDGVLEFIANKIRSSIRELEGALAKIHAHARFSQDKIDVETTGRILGELYDRPVKEISIEKIQRKVADYFNLKPSDIIGKNRSRSIAGPRQVAMYLSRRLTRHSFPEIGTFFGNKDHTTVLFACNKIEREMETDEVLRANVQHLVDSFSTY